MTLRVSRNEITAMLKQAFGGLGYAPGICEDAARTVVWHEMHGLGGFRQLEHALANATALGQAGLAILSADEATTVIDAQGNSCMTCSGLVIEIAGAGANRHGVFTVSVLNSHHPELVYERLCNAGNRGLACLAYWRSPANPSTLMLAAAGPREADRVLRGYEAGPGIADDGSLTIVCSLSTDAIVEHQSKMQLQDLPMVSRSDASKMAVANQSAIDSGTAISGALVRELQALAKELLVPSSEDSRAGAGH